MKAMCVENQMMKELRRNDLCLVLKIDSTSKVNYFFVNTFFYIFNGLSDRDGSRLFAWRVKINDEKYFLLLYHLLFRDF